MLAEPFLASLAVEGLKYFWAFPTLIFLKSLECVELAVLPALLKTVLEFVC